NFSSIPAVHPGIGMSLTSAQAMGSSIPKAANGSQNKTDPRADTAGVMNPSKMSVTGSDLISDALVTVWPCESVTLSVYSTPSVRPVVLFDSREVDWLLHL